MPNPSEQKKAPVEPAEFEQEEEEQDPLNPSPSIIQSYDVGFGTELLKIALPPVPPCTPSQFPEHLPQYFAKNLLVAVACADCSVRLVSVPLVPPSLSAKSQRYIGEQILSISGPLHHQEDINCIALTWTEYVPEGDDDDDSEDEHMEAKTRPACPQILVASHSLHFYGKLLIHRARLTLKEDEEVLTDRLTLIRNHFLKCPLSILSFSTSHIHHPNAPVLLLALDQKHSVKFYNPFISPSTVLKSGSRRMVDDISSGAWLTSFAPDFAAAKVSHSSPDIPQRKRIIDAQWVFSSAAIMVLLSDGEWGVWSVGELSSYPAPPIIGGAIAQFTILGSLPPSEDSEGPSGARAKGFTPATPNTRKSRTADFLSGSSGKANTKRGGIRVVPLSNSDEPDERVILWYDNHVYAVTSFRNYWERHVPNQRVTTPVIGTAIPKAENLDLQGERCNGVEPLPGPGFSPTGMPELLVVGEHRLTFITKEPDASQPAPSQALVPIAQDIEMDDADQALLAREELDLGGVDRMLDSMGGNAAEQRAPRRVGFAH